MSLSAHTLKGIFHGLVDKLRFTTKEREILISSMNELIDHSPDTFAHCMSVGEYSRTICDIYDVEKNTGATPEDIFVASYFHDIGRILTPGSVVKKTYIPDSKLSADDELLIKKHPENGMFLLLDTFPKAAVVIGLHHSFQPDSPLNNYPDPLPEILKKRFDYEMENISLMTLEKAVPISDYLHAVSRPNSRYRVDDLNNYDKIISKLKEERAPLKEHIEHLDNIGFFKDILISQNMYKKVI